MKRMDPVPKFSLSPGNAAQEQPQAVSLPVAAANEAHSFLVISNLPAANCLILTFRCGLSSG